MVQLKNRDIADEALEQRVERLAPEQGGGAHPLERHVGVRDGEDVLAAQIDRDLAQLGDAVARRPGSADERTHARADDVRREEAALGESLEHPDVREAFHAAAAENETEACVTLQEIAACPEGEFPSNVVVGPMPALLIHQRIVRSRWAMAGLAVVTALTLVALAAPWLAPGDPYRGAMSHVLRPPSGSFLLGSDAQGRDVLSRVLYGARLSLAVGLISQSIALTIGVTLGLLAGFYGRWMDSVIMRVADVTLAFPSLLLLIAIAAAVKPSLPVVFVVIGLVGWAGMARLVRGQVLLARGLEYVQAARALGASDVRIIARHLLPNVIAPVIVAATLGIGGAIMAEAALSFIGLGAQPPTPSWGAIVAEGRDLLRVAPWVSLFPGLAIGVAVLGLNLLGDGLRDALDVRA